MVSTFHGIEMGKRSLLTHSKALMITGHNLNNMNNEGYTRQMIHMESFEPIYMPDMTRAERTGQIGQGVVTARIERVRDSLVDNRIIFENKNQGYYKVRDKYLEQVELVYQEPGVNTDPSRINTLRTGLDEFMSSWSDLANNPYEKSMRSVVVQKANILTNSVRHHYSQLKDIRDNIDTEFQDKVREVNNIAKDIALLNEKILKVETMKDNPNDLKDQRDMLIDRLSELVDVQISREDPDELILFIGGRHLVQGGKYEQLQLESQAENEGYFDAFWGDGEKLVLRGGELAGLVDLRDTDLNFEIKKVNSFAANVTDLVNEIHSDGFGANGKTGVNFFVQFPFVNDPAGNYDRNGDGQDDSTFLFRVSGSNKLELNDKLGIRGQMIINDSTVDYYETDTVSEVITRINQSDARVNAFLNTDGKLTLKADYQVENGAPDFAIRRLQDDGLFLTGYASVLQGAGEEGAFDYNQINQVDKFTERSNWAVAPLTHPSAYMSVNEQVLADHNNIATAEGIDSTGDGVKDVYNKSGDSEIAQRIASLKDKKVMVGMSQTFSQYFETVISDLGARSNVAEKGLKNAETIVHNLKNIRKSISGVNIDEEFANMMKFQHGYNATAKIMSEMDKMIETLIMRLG